MHCKNCGYPLLKNALFCTNCGTLIKETNATPANSGPRRNITSPIKPYIQEVSPTQPYPSATSVPQGQSEPSAAPPSPQKNKKNKKNKKKPSGCLIAFLIFLVIGFIMGLIGIFLLGKIIPGGSSGNSGNQQIQPSYSEPAASTPLRASLNGSYMPDENDFRFDDSDSITGYVDHVILVFFQSDVTDDEVQRVAALVNGELIGCIDSIDCFELRVPVSGRDALEALCETLLKEKSVIRACTDSVDYSTTLEWSDPNMEDVVPNDPWGEWTWFPQEIRNVILQQWSMILPRGKNWHQELIGAPSAWAYSEYYSHVSVGVIDGGFDTEHSDLQITVVNSFANNQTRDNKEMADSYNHGTHVAGIIGATRGNGSGINGILSGPYTLYGFCVNNVNVQSVNLTASAMMLNEGCRVINRSRGLPWHKWEDSKGVEHYAIAENGRPFNPDTGVEYTDEVWNEEGVAAAKDVLILLQAYGPRFMLVNSAGNSGIEARYNGWICSVTRECAERAVEEMPGTGYTADDIMNAIIIVGAVAQNENYGNYSISDTDEILCDRNLELTDFSNHGDQVTVCAPGYNIYSTVRNGYDSYPGTSMAAPIVAACAAQIWSVDTDQTPGQVKARLLSTATDGVAAVSRFDGDGSTYSIVNLKDAVESLLLERGLISETRPDGDLIRLIDEYIGGIVEEGATELENLGARFANELVECDFFAAFGTLCEMIKKWLSLVFYALLYLLAGMVLPGGTLN